MGSLNYWEGQKMHASQDGVFCTRLGQDAWPGMDETIVLYFQYNTATVCVLQPNGQADIWRYTEAYELFNVVWKQQVMK